MADGLGYLTSGMTINSSKSLSADYKGNNGLLAKIKAEWDGPGNSFFVKIDGKEINVGVNEVSVNIQGGSNGQKMLSVFFPNRGSSVGLLKMYVDKKDGKVYSDRPSNNAENRATENVERSFSPNQTSNVIPLLGADGQPLVLNETSLNELLEITRL